jgi:hypothetical protein
MKTTLSPTDMHRTFLAMECHGGGFCARLAGAWYAADPGNKRCLEEAFPHLLEKFGPDSAYFYLQNH